jgi:hypothetical protein
MRLLEFLILLEKRDRIQYLSDTFQNKIIQVFQSEDQKGNIPNMPETRAIKELFRSMEDDPKEELTSKISNKIVTRFSEFDPTSKKKYTDWILRQWLNGMLLWEDAYKMNDLLSDFEEYKPKLSKKDLNLYKDYRTLDSEIGKYRGTQVAGIRVGNFVNKDETQKFLKSSVPNPDSQEFKDLKQKEEEYDEEPPTWFINDLYGQYIELLTHEIDEEDYMDEDGVIDYDQMNYDIAANANNMAHQDAEEEWQSYLEDQMKDLRARTTQKGKRPELEPYFISPRLAVFIPNSEDSACYIGSGTKWCTSATGGENYFWEYRKDGPLYSIITDKMGKYQFHFETGSFMNEQDKEIGTTKEIIPLLNNYKNELRTAFKEEGLKYGEIWLVNANEISENIWDNFLRAAKLSKPDELINMEISDEITLYDLCLRVYLGHKDDAPSGWSETMRNALIYANPTRSLAQVEIMNKEEMTQDYLHNLIMDLVVGKAGEVRISEQELVKWINENNISLRRDTWEMWVKESPWIVAFVPEEIIDERLKKFFMQNDQGIKRLLKHYDILKKYADREGLENTSEILNIEKMLSMVTVEEAREEVVNNIHGAVFQYVYYDLPMFRDYFGDVPWLTALEQIDKKVKDESQRKTILTEFIRGLISIHGDRLLAPRETPKINHDKIVRIVLRMNPELRPHFDTRRFNFISASIHEEWKQIIIQKIMEAPDWHIATRIASSANKYLEKDVKQYIEDIIYQKRYGYANPQHRG